MGQFRRRCTRCESSEKGQPVDGPIELNFAISSPAFLLQLNQSPAKRNHFVSETPLATTFRPTLSPPQGRRLALSEMASCHTIRSCNEKPKATDLILSDANLEGMDKIDRTIYVQFRLVGPVLSRLGAEISSVGRRNGVGWRGVFLATSGGAAEGGRKGRGLGRIGYTKCPVLNSGCGPAGCCCQATGPGSAGSEGDSCG
jgi:hypothetical protein